MAKKQAKKAVERKDSLADVLYDDFSGETVTRSIAQGIVRDVVREITFNIVNKYRCRVPGLGVFTVRQRKARMGHNPRTGAVIQIPARRVVGFKASAALAEHLQ